MTTITTRAGKGSPLTHAELDANFTNLNANKLEESGGQLQIAGKFVPTTTGTQDQGAAALRWGTGYYTNINYTGTLTGGQVAIFGNGDTSATPASATLRGTDASGTDIDGVNLIIRPGRPTGAGAGGSFVVQTAPAGTTGAALGALSTRLVVDQYGRWGVGGVPSVNWFNASCFIDFNGGRGAVGVTNGNVSPDSTFLVANAIAATNDISTTAWTYKATGGASKIELRNGFHAFVAGSGTAGATVSWTDALAITTVDARFALPVAPSANGGTTSGTSALRWSTTYTQALDAAGNILTSGAAATIGYATGSGGTVTQATSKATGVTLNKGSGQITTAADALAAGATATFTFTNSLIAAADQVLVQRQSGGTAGAYHVWCDSSAAGSCTICIRNISAGSLSEVVVLNFKVIKGATA